ncbi:MAG TPA: hypothetical protein VGC96_01325 [Candidatus Elarobacter sp.]|jgi:hypothetical protein
MIQTQWPGLGQAIDFSSLDGATGDGRRLWPGDGTAPAAASSLATDGIARPWWTCRTGLANSANPLGALLGAGGTSGGSLFGLVSGLVNTLQQLVAALLNQGLAQGSGGAQSQTPPGFAGGGPEQHFSNVDVSSTGDPHIGEVGTREDAAGAHAVDAHWDSMSSHDDLVHSNQIAGGYRVSTTVTAPDANGVTLNQSATVHTNYGQDAITMNRDGSFAIYDDGAAVALGRGESATLSGGEQVSANQDGSLTVNARNRGGGTIATTLRSTGGGVDVTTHARDLNLGGDVVAHDALSPQAPHPPHHRRAPVAGRPAPLGPVQL